MSFIPAEQDADSKKPALPEALGAASPLAPSSEPLRAGGV